MKLKEYLENLNHHVAQKPEILEFEVVYATDEEGNSYKKVVFEPCIIYFEDLKAYHLEATDSSKNPALCIN